MTPEEFVALNLRQIIDLIKKMSEQISQLENPDANVSEVLSKLIELNKEFKPLSLTQIESDYERVKDELIEFAAMQSSLARLLISTKALEQYKHQPDQKVSEYLYFLRVDLWE